MARGKVIPAVLAVLLTGAAARADLTPVSESDAGRRPTSCGLQHSDLSGGEASSLLARLAATDLDFRFCGIAPDEHAPLAPTSESAPLYLLSDRQSGISLCLYALLGLGLCKAGPCVKRLSWGGIPAWYCGGFYYQVGHHFAVSPDCLCAAAVCCLVPPRGKGGDPAVEYRSGALASLWRQSQFTPGPRAARGPPLRRGALICRRSDCARCLACALRGLFASA